MNKLKTTDSNLKEVISNLEEIKEEGIFKNMLLRSVHSSSFNFTDGVIKNSKGEELETIDDTSSEVVIFSRDEDEKASPCYVAIINNSNEKFLKVYTGILFEGTLLPSIEETPDNIKLDVNKVKEILTEHEDKITERVNKFNSEVQPVKLNELEVAMFKGILGYLSNFPTSMVDKVKNTEDNIELLTKYYDLILNSDSSQYIKRALELEKSMGAFNSVKVGKERMFTALKEIKRVSESLTIDREDAEIKSLVENIGKEKTLKILKAL